MPITPGDMLAHYCLVEKLGEGGMGAVWKAMDTRLDRVVAIKLLDDGLAQDREWLRRFEHEAKAVAALNHPSIVTIYSVEEAAGVRFFTMEFLGGRSLDQLIPASGQSLRTFLDVAVPLADALAATHASGLVHRDIKPANVMVGADGRVKVLDFGLAQVPGIGGGTGRLDRAAQAFESTSLLWGTLPYLSPECICAEPIDHRSDIFSLGVLLYEMATGRRPFGGDAAGEILDAILQQTPPLVTALRRDFPLHVSRIIRQCLEKDPAARPQSAAALRAELEELRREQEAARRAAAPAIAVLPFVDMSFEKDQEHFCEGIAEEIINVLAKVGELRVASRQSSFRFRATPLDSRAIGRDLGVDALLEGSVRKVGTRLRVGAELTNVRDGLCLWSELFDREVKDVFVIQEEIARSIVRALAVTLSPLESDALRRPRTNDLEAYDLYLRGRRYFHQYTKKGTGFALEMFGRALERDPGFAPAWAGVADCYSYLSLYVERSEANRQRAEEASCKALDLDPDLAQARVSRGLALSLGGRHEAAEREFEHAIRLNPQLFEAFYFYARDTFAQGKNEAAIRLYEQAMALRPDDYQAPLLVAQLYADIGRGADAEVTRRRGLRVAEEHLQRHPDDVRALYMAANAQVATGESERGREWAQRALTLEPDDPIVLYNVACIRSLAGDVEGALDCLERAARTGQVQIDWVVHDSNLDAVRGHPRYAVLLRAGQEGGAA
jgi:serine/threonine protein kinase/Flp pilus assembly protein TadD